MKLHLPSGLRAALFACFAAFAGIGSTLTTATITGGVFAVTIASFQAQAASSDVDGIRTYTGADNSNIQPPSENDGIHTVEFKMTNSGTANWMGAGNFSQNILISDDATTDAVEGFCITNGNGDSRVFSGAVSGNGLLSKTGSGTGNKMIFTGDVTQFTGDISLAAGSGRTFTLGFGGDTEGAGAVVSENVSELKGVSGTGNIVFSSSDNTLVYNYANPAEGAARTAYVTNTISTTGDANSKLTVAGAADVTFTKAVSVKTLTLTSSGVTTLKGASSVTGSLTINENASLAIAANGSLTLNGAVSGLVGVTNDGVITFGDGAMLTLEQADFTEANGTYTLSLFTGSGSMSGLTADKIDGVVTAGRSWTFNPNGTISYTVTSNMLSFTGGDLAWNVGVEMTGGQFASGDIVTFSGNTTATMGAPISAAIVTVEGGATLSLSNGGVAENTLTTANLVVNGTLTLKDAALAADSRVVAESTGSVVIDIDPAKDINVQDQLVDFTGTLDVQSGRYDLNKAKANPFASINVHSGGQLNLTAAYSGNISLEGHGPGGAWRDTALRMAAAISGKVTIGEAGSSIAVNGDHTLSGTLAGSGDLKKTEGGKLILTGNITNTGALDILGGSVRIGNAPGDTNSMSFSSINVGANTTLEFHHDGANFSHTDITLNSGATLYMEDSACGNTVPIPNPVAEAVALGKLTMAGDAKIKWNWKGAFSFTEMTGAGNLALDGRSAGNDPRATIISSMNNYKGTISGVPYKHVLYLGSVHQDAGHTAIINGVSGETQGSSVYLTDFAKTGAGDLVITDGVSVSGILTMNYEGGLYCGLLEGTSDIDTSKTGLNITSVAEGTMLSYTTATNVLNLTSTAVGSTVLTLDLAQALLNGTPADGVNLGIASDVSLSQLHVGASVTGGQLVQKNGTWWYTGGTFHTDWDINWGAAEIATAPASLASRNDVGASMGLADDATYYSAENGTTGILITGTSEGGAGAIVYGGWGTDQAAGATLEADSWIKMTGGDLGLIVGGNNCATWEGYDNLAMHFSGDAHILITQEEGKAAPVVDYIIGGNYKDGHGADFTGNTYITLESNSLQGAVIGGSLHSHNRNADALFTGDSHIYVYTPQTLQADTALGENLNAIIGGSLEFGKNGGTVVFNGDTHILLDFSSPTTEATMTKAVIGASSRLDNGNISHTGDTNITIRNTGATTFTQDIIGGTKNGNATLSGDTNITISSADTTTFSGNIIGGSLGGGATIALNGTTHTSISSGKFDGKVIGGSYDNTGATTLSVSGVEMSLSGGTYNGVVIGGNYDSGNGDAANNWTIGDISVTVSGTANVACDLLGGSHARRNNGNVTYSQGGITVNLQGGSVRNVYAAGYQENASRMTTASTTLNIAAGVTIAENSIISGGYGGSGTGSVVTGTRTLNFTSTGVYDKLGNATFKDFDKIVIGAGTSVTMGALSLGEGATLQLDMTGAAAQGTAMLNVSGDAALTLGGAVNLELGGVGGLAINSSYTLLEWKGDGVTLDQFVCDLSAYKTDETDYVLAIDGNKLVLNIGTIMEYWDWADADGGTWGDVSSWGQTEGSPDEKTLTFSDSVFSDSATTNTVTIAGQVAPAAVVVTPGAGHSYEFTGEGGIAAGTLEMNGAGTLVLATTNASTGTLTITQGTVQLGKDTTGASWAGSVVNNGALTVVADSSVGGYDAASTGTISVADGKTLTVGSVANLDGLIALFSKSSGEGTIALSSSGTIGEGAGTGGQTVTLSGNYKIGSDWTTFQSSALTSLSLAGSMELNKLVLYKNQDFTVADGGSLNATNGVIIETDSKLTLSGGTLTIDGGEGINMTNASSAFVMTGGTLKLGANFSRVDGSTVSITGGTLQTANDRSIDKAVTLGAVTIDAANAGKITFSGDATITDTIINNGMLVLSGQISLADGALAELTSEGGQVLSGINGFAQTKYYVVDGRGNEKSSLTASDTEMTVSGVTYTLTVDKGSLTFLTSGNSGLYYVNTDSVTYGGADSDMPVANVEGLVLNGGALVLASGLDAAATEGITLKQNSTITLDGTGVQLNGTSVTCEGNSKLTLAGSGTYVASEVASLEKLASPAVSTDWTGNVLISNTTTGGNGLTLNQYTNANSTVTLSGVSGHISNGAWATDNICLVDTADAAAFTVTNSNTNPLTFSGAISGEGTMKNSSTASDINYAYTGNVSGWTGAFDNAVDQKATLSFSDSATELNLDLKATAGTIDLTISNDNAVTVNSAITGNVNVTYSGAGVKSVTNTTSSYTSTTTISAGTVKLASGVSSLGAGTEIAAGATLHLQGNTLSNDITNAGTLLVSGASSISSLAGGALELSAKLTVTGAASGLTSLTVTTTPLAELCAGGALVSAGSVALADELTVNVGGALLSTSEVGEYTLLSSGATIDTADKKLTLAVGADGDKVKDNGDGTFTVGQIKYTLGFNAGADALVLTGAVMDSDAWDDAQGSTWAPTTSDGFAGSQPGAEDLVSFTGSDTVKIDASGAPIAVAGVRVETDGAYTFTGESKDGSDTIESESVAVVKGELTLDNVTIETGEVTVGSSSSSAGLTVGDGSTLNASEMQVNAGTDASGLVVEAGAKVEVAGALKSATDASITVAGNLTMGTLSSVDTLTVEGDAATVSVGGTNVTIGEVDGTGTLASFGLGMGADVTVGSDLTVQALNGAGGSALELSGTNAAGETEYHDLVIESASKAGSVVAGNVTLNGEGNYSFTSLDAKGDVTGSDNNLALAGDSSMASLTGVNKLTINTGDVTVGSDVTLDQLAGTGTIELSTTDATNGSTSYHNLEIESASTAGKVVAGDVTLSGEGDYSFTSLDAKGAVTGSDSNLALAGTSSMDSLTGVDKLTITGDTSVVTVGSDVTTDLASNAGTLDVGDYTLTLTDATTDGGNVSAGALDISGVSGVTAVDSLTTDRIVLDVTGIKLGTDALLQVGGALTQLTQTSTFALDSTGGVTIELTGIPTGASTQGGAVDGIDATTAVGATAARDWATSLEMGDYTLISYGSLVGGLTLVTPSLDNIQQLFALDGVDAWFTEVTSGGMTSVVMHLTQATDREWNSNTPAWAGKPGEAQLGIDLSTGRPTLAVATYDMFNTVSKVTMAGNYTIDLSGSDMTDDTDPNKGLIIRDLDGTGTLTLKGADYQDDLATIDNSAERTLAGNLVAENITVSVQGAKMTVADLVSDDDAWVRVYGSMGVSGDATATNLGWITVEGGATLDVSGQTTASAEGRVEVLEGGSMTAADILLQDGELYVAAGGELTADSLTLEGDDARVDAVGVVLAGAINGTEGTISGSFGLMDGVAASAGSYSGKYDNAAVVLAEGAAQNFTIGGESGSQTFIFGAAKGASSTLSYSGDATLMGLYTEGADITLDRTGTLTAGNDSVMQGGSLSYKLDAQEVIDGTAAVVTSGIDLVGTKVHANAGDSTSGMSFDVENGTTGWTLFSHEGATSLTAADVSLDGKFFERYFENVTVENGVVKADLITDYYTEALGETENGKTGLQMLDMAELQVSPQEGDLKEVLDSLKGYMGTKDTAAADKLASAVAGSGLASVGMALAGDVERQLKAIRNRTTTMGVDPSVVNEGMPYFNAWINAEGDHRSLDQDSSMAGYRLTSWGGTVGFDMDVEPTLTWGLALTAMYGDFNAESADVVEGDMDTYYVSAFARKTSGAWVHTFVATAGLSKSDISRTVSHSGGSYTTQGEADGMSFGFLYEVARTFALNEDATACWQPIFNVSYRHTSVDGYDEEGSDAALSVGDQTLNTLTFGLGGRIQAVVGENIYNRTSVFEARALVKYDVGDTESEMDTALLSASAAKGSVKSAEMDAFGIELGAGLSIPVGMESGTIFLDGSVEFRGSYTSANGTVGYRVNF